MTQVVLSINGKGGTGKTMCAIEIAKRLRDSGHEVGLMDADIDSANLSARLGVDEKVSFKGDHTVEPVEHNGLVFYSMQNAFEDSSFSQDGEFMRTVIKNMVNGTDWGSIDYIVVDCPPGSSDVFDEVVRALRTNLLGAVSVGISDAVEDTIRLVKVCGHNWVPVIGFIENMSGLNCHGETMECPHEGGAIEPFGSGKIKELADKSGGTFLGSIPLCAGDAEPADVASDTFDNVVEKIESAELSEIPEENHGNKSFIRNVWKTIRETMKMVNEELDVQEIQDKYGVEDRDPLVISIELTDAKGLTGIFSEVILTVDSGEMKVMRPKKAKRKGIPVEGGLKITSQDLHDAIRGEKKVMKAATGEVTSASYSITDAVTMGDAEMWGEKTVNRLAVIDRIMSEVIEPQELREKMKN